MVRLHRRPAAVSDDDYEGAGYSAGGSRADHWRLAQYGSAHWR